MDSGAGLCSWSARKGAPIRVDVSEIFVVRSRNPRWERGFQLGFRRTRKRCEVSLVRVWDVPGLAYATTVGPWQRAMV